MSDLTSSAGRPTLASARRRPIDLPADDDVDVDVGALTAGAAYPLRVSPHRAGLHLDAWASPRRAWIIAALAERGAVLFRRFHVGGVEGFERAMRIVCPSLLEYTERSTPRTSVGHDIYTSTEYPAHLDIAQHNENSYASTWPRTIAFYCETPAERGGETPLADSAEVYRTLPAGTRDRFVDHGVMYVRNYGLGVDLSWQDAFRTSEPSVVDDYCRRAAIACEWLDGGRRLRTRQVRPAVARHPVTNEWLWFNQAHLFHTSGLDAATREALHGTFADEDLPRHAWFGDGSPIPVALLDEVRDAYRQTMLVFSWQPGDVLLVDNMRISHGRKAFTGNRKVLVAMADPCGHATEGA